MNAPIDAGLAEALATLGLRPDADARSVKRAYAQQVKQIDQATQLQEFQTLREAYELALAVVKRQEAQALDAAPASLPAEAAEQAEPLQPTPPAARADFAPPDSAELARAVFQGFAARASAGFKEEAEATAALQDALADERLLNLEARTLFELQVAHRIMEGWQPGHEFLFGPACEVFHWESDRSHLRVFGQLGGALDAAINEKLIFFRQSPGEFDLQRNVIRRLRQADMPSVKLRRADLPLVQMLVQRYPNWLRLITSQSNINSWFHDLPEEVVTAAELASAPPLQETGQRSGLGNSLSALSFGIFVLVALLMLAMSLSRPTMRTAPQPSTQKSAGASGGPPISTWPPNSSLGTSTPGDTPFSQGPQRSLYDLPQPLFLPAPAGPHDPQTAQPPVRLTQALERLDGETVRFLGGASFVTRKGQILVLDVGARTQRSESTLQPGDLVVSCASSDPLKLLTDADDVKLCVATGGTRPVAGVTVYMFRILRKGRPQTSSLTLREAVAPKSS